ncbi:MAG: GEVED domain-containing protein [Bacteroidales bacterium]
MKNKANIILALYFCVLLLITNSTNVLAFSSEFSSENWRKNHVQLRDENKLMRNETSTLTSQYCAAGSFGANFEYISNVAIGSINKTSGIGIDGYQDFTSQLATLQIGVSISATISITDFNIGDQIFIWIDWNQDGDFDDIDENVYASSGFAFSSPLTTTAFAPPNNAAIGTTRMRIRLHDTSFGSNNTPCGNSDYGEVEDYSINVIGAGCSPPSIQATAFTASAITNTSLTAGWTRGNGNSVLVLARQGSAVNADPINGVVYTANSAFGSGSQIGTANYVVYNGVGTSVNVTALSLGSNYYYAIYEFNTSGNCYKTSALTGNAITSGASQCNYCIAMGSMEYNTSITSINFNTLNNLTAKTAAYNNYTGLSTNVNKNSIYNLSVKLNTDGDYITHAYAWIDWNQDCDFLDANEDYDLGIANNVASGFSSLSPKSITIPATALTGSTRMRIAVKYDSSPISCETDFDGEVEDYTLNITSSTCTPPSIQATAFISSAITDSSMTIGFVRGNGSSVLVVAHKGSAVNAIPISGTNYTANAAFGSGSQIGTDNYVVYNGNSNSINITSLTAGTNYYYAIYEYNTSEFCYKIPALTDSVKTTGIQPYCSAGSTGSNFEYISNVSIGSINQMSVRGVNGYQNYTSQITTMYIGINTSAIISVANSNIGDQLIIWVDWNKDGDFADAGENVYTSSGVSFTSPHTTAYFAPPLGTALGTYRMRIRLHDTSFGSNTTPCGDSDYGEVEDYSINVTATPCTPPTIQASAFTSSSITNHNMNIGFLRGNGDSILVIARNASALNAEPLNGVVYNANTAFGNGSEIGTANFVVYKGIGSSANITALVSGTTYYYAVYEFSSASHCYKTPALTGSVQTTGVHPYCEAGSLSNLSTAEYISTVTMGSINQVSGKGIFGYQDFTSQLTGLQIGETASVSISTTNDYQLNQVLIWVDWNHDNDFADTNERVYVSGGSFVSPIITSITPPLGAAIGITTMRIRLDDTDNGANPFPCGFSQWGEVEDYSINVIAPCTPPTTQAFSFSTSAITSTSMKLTWTRGNGDSVIVVARQGSAVNANPINENIYIANSAFGLGSQIGSGNYVMYKGTATSANINNLANETSYYFAVYEYNSNRYCYKTPALTGMGVTTRTTTFTAAISSAWENNANWDHGIPTPTTDAFIPSNTFAIINSNNYECNNLTIAPLGYLSINTSKDLRVNGAFTIHSDATGSGSFINKGSLHSTTNTIERYIPVISSEDFHVIGSPIANQLINTDFCPGIQSFYIWNELNGLWVAYEDNGFNALNGSNNFVPGRGYAVSYPSTSTKNFIGTINQGSVAINLSVSSGNYSGWNLIANPYPSAIYWDEPTGWTRNILANAGGNQKAMWIWNAALGNYGTYISNTGFNAGTNGVTPIIAMAQGFWVKAATAGTVVMTNNIQEHSFQEFLKSQSTNTERLRILVSTTENNFKDELIINFGNTNDEGGAEKMFSINASAPSIYSTKLNKNWSINNLTSMAENATIPIGFKPGIDGNYTISSIGVQALGNVMLEDLKTGTQQNLSVNSNYSFNAQTSDNENRFLLHFTASGINNMVDKKPSINYSNQTINVFNPWLGNTMVNIFDVNGKLIQTYTAKEGYSNYPFNPSKGVYVIKLQNEQHVFIKKEVIY